jgi:NAD(P)-dependent dehydrogenase (short-subunit alcohol dehydrogenase family)
MATGSALSNKAPAELLAEIEPQLGAVDVLVAAAGLSRLQTFEEVSLEDSDELKARVPVGRLGLPDEVADLALAILRNVYMTSQVVSVDGGMYPH